MPTTGRRFGSPVLIATALYVLAHAAWLATHVGGAAWRVAIADAFMLPTFLATGLAALRTARHPALDARVRRAWGWLAASYVLLWLANAAWTWRDLGPGAPPSINRWAHGLVLVSYVPLLVGLLGLPSAPRARDHRRRFALDLAITVLGAGLVLWCLVIRPAAGDSSAGFLAEIGSFDTAVLDLAVVAVLVALLLGRLDAGSRVALRLLAAGQLLSVAAGVVTAVVGGAGPIPVGSWLDGLWMLSDALLLAAADVQWRRADDGRADDSGADDGGAGTPAAAADGGFSLVPYAGVALAYSLLLWVSRPWWGQSLGVAIFGSVAISALVVVRQVGALRDNQRLVAERLAQDEYFRGLIEHATDVVYVADFDGTLRYASPSAGRAFGYVPGTGIGRPVFDFVHRDDAARVRAALDAAADGTRSAVELRVRHADGRWRVVDAAVGRLPGREPQLVLNVRDVSERAEAAAALRESQRALETLLRNLPGMAYRCRNTPEWPFEFASEGAFDLTGYPAADLAGADAPRVQFADLMDPDDRERVWAAVQGAVAERLPFQMHYRITTADGRTRNVWEQGRAVYDARGAVVALEGFIMDVTEQKRLESRLEHQAFHDSLTGLANRALFRDRVAQALARAAREGTRPCVLFLDLDDFKAVNDSLGHAEGDRLLVEVAARLLNATRGCDTVARLGGDEFAVLLASTAAHDEAAIVADRIMRALARPVALAGRDVVVRGSVGIAAPAPGDGTEELLRNADLAMYHAKARGKGTCETFAAEMYEAIHDRVALEADMRTALDRREFWLAYQPIVDLGSGRVVGVEALARWEHPRRGPVSPGRFVGVAEESGLILPLGRWVLGEACRQGAAWRRGGADDLYIAVNISGRQLQDPTFVADVDAALRESGLAPHALLIEITEGVVMQHTAANLARLAELKALGVRLAIDDFGTGYSSLSYLQRFPVDVLKIDKSFVDGVHDGGSHEALARTIVALGRTLSLSTVAEGVERPEQRETLRALGCTLGQGYLFSRPVPPGDVEALLARSAAAAR